MTPEPTLDQYLSTSTVADRLNVSQKTIIRWITLHDIKHSRIPVEEEGKAPQFTYLIHEPSLVKFIKKHEKGKI
jgi:transposase